LEAFSRERPDSYEALSMLAVCRLRSGDAEAARSLIERGLELDGRDALSYEIYGDILDALGHHAEARLQWERSLRLNPYSRSLQSKLGQRKR
jgi:tetratricopeptide (TPR) repeat protein